MRIVVSDTSCMVDLRKAALLEALLLLPYTVVMPDTLFADEWLCLSDEEKNALCALGLDVRSLPGPLVETARETLRQNKMLTLNDCFALTLAEDIGDCILLTGDGPLRRIAEHKGLEVHGVLWVADELEAHGVVTAEVLYAALQVLAADDLVFLPKDEVLRRLRRLGRQL